MSAFKKAVTKGDIRFHGQLANYADSAHWKAFLDSLYAKNWVTYCKPPFAGAGQVLKYLGGYTHRIAISNHRITRIDENCVSFKWRSYADESKTKLMTLSHVEFIRRFLLHVLPKGYQRIRYYGFLANCKRKKALTRCFEILQAKYESAKTAMKEKRVIAERGLLGLLKEIYNIDLKLCPQCQQPTLRPVFSGVRYSKGVF